MKEMNSLTHSCMHSLASLAILAFSGNAVFMIRATGAKLRMLASEAAAPCKGLLVSCEAGGEGGAWSEDMMGAEWLKRGADQRELSCDAVHAWSEVDATNEEVVLPKGLARNEPLGFAQCHSQTRRHAQPRRW
jgi:hypothetical protein